MILSLTTEYAWGEKELESLWLNKNISCDGFKIISSLNDNFDLEYYELNCWLTKSSVLGIEKFLSENQRKKISSIHAFAPIGDNFEIGTPLYKPYNLGSCKPNFRKCSVDALKSTIELSNKLGAEYVVIHAGFMERNKERNENIESFSKSLEEAINFIEEKNYNVRIGIETCVYPYQIFIDSREIKSFKKFYPKAGLWLDVGHAFVNKNSDLYDIAEKCCDILVGFHLHNNNGKKDLHLAVDCGKIDITRVLSPFKERVKQNKIPLVLEIKNSNTDGVKRSIDLVKNIIYS